MFFKTVVSVLHPFTGDASCAVPGDPTWRRHARRDDTERDGDRCACESGVSARRNERISIRSPPSCSDMAFHLLKEEGKEKCLGVVDFTQSARLCFSPQ